MINSDRGIEFYCSKLEQAEGYGAVWETVKETVKDCLGKHRVGMMLFLDYLPLQLGAYHPVGTNNIVLNRRLVEVVEATADSKLDVNAFVYSLLLHEYLHALGVMAEDEVRQLVYRVSLESFGKDHIATDLAKKSPWALLQGAGLTSFPTSKGPMEIVRDFDKPGQNYIS